MVWFAKTTSRRGWLAPEKAFPDSLQLGSFSEKQKRMDSSDLNALAPLGPSASNKGYSCEAGSSRAATSVQQQHSETETRGVQISVYAVPMFKEGEAVHYAYIPVHHGPIARHLNEHEHATTSLEPRQAIAGAAAQGIAAGRAAAPLERGCLSASAMLSQIHASQSCDRNSIAHCKGIEAVAAEPGDSDAAGCSISRASDCHRPTQSCNSSPCPNTPAEGPSTSPPAAPAPAASATPSASMVGSMQHHAQSTWESWGRLRKGTWLRWLYDMGQTVTEDVSAEARLARGISSKATKVTVYHPECVSQEEAHEQVKKIVAARSRSELWRMVGAMALLPVGFLLDHSLLVAVPAPLGTGYSSYKAYIHYKGVRGSWRMQQLIQGYQVTHTASMPCGGDQTPRTASWSSKGAQSEALAASCNGASGFSLTFSSPPGPTDAAGPGAPARGVGACTVDALSASHGGSSSPGTGSSPSADRGFAASQCKAVSCGWPSGRLPDASQQDTGYEGDQLRKETGRQTHEQRMLEARTYGAHPLDCHSGLQYVTMPQLNGFVAELLDTPEGVLPEEAAEQLCSLLPLAHRAEVARHIAELRRRHARQAQRAAARAAWRERRLPGSRSQELSKLELKHGRPQLGRSSLPLTTWERTVDVVHATDSSQRRQEGERRRSEDELSNWDMCLVEGKAGQRGTSDGSRGAAPAAEMGGRAVEAGDEEEDGVGQEQQQRQGFLDPLSAVSAQCMVVGSA